MTAATAALTRYRRPHRKSRHHAAGASQFFPRISLTAANHTCIIHPSFLPACGEERQDARNFAHQLFIARMVRVA